MDWKNGYLKRIPLTKRIRSIVAKTHNLNPSDIIINWVSQWREVKYPTGRIEKFGVVRLHAPGFKPRKFFIFQHKDEKWYMN